MQAAGKWDSMRWRVMPGRSVQQGALPTGSAPDSDFCTRATINRAADPSLASATVSYTETLSAIAPGSFSASATEATGSARRKPGTRGGLRVR